MEGDITPFLQMSLFIMPPLMNALAATGVGCIQTGMQVQIDPQNDNGRCRKTAAILLQKY
jgi:hypothetical protein